MISEKETKIDNDARKPFFTTKDVSGCLDIPLKDRVRVLLFRKAMSQNEFADLVGITKATMSNIINNHWIPTSRIKLKMAQVLECDSLVLFGAMEYWKEWRLKVGYPE